MWPRIVFIFSLVLFYPVNVVWQKPFYTQMYIDENVVFVSQTKKPRKEKCINLYTYLPFLFTILAKENFQPFSPPVDTETSTGYFPVKDI